MEVQFQAFRHHSIESCDPLSKASTFPPKLSEFGRLHAEQISSLALVRALLCEKGNTKLPSTWKESCCENKPDYADQSDALDRLLV